ncbi:MAG TPA: glycosyltransferase, partial [Candidatus Wirthbacteria bacterium]|nr:glycosyltransferase [Candidatus Wirthbacteria bacterium]
MVSIILATYNQSENLGNLIRQIFEVAGQNKIQVEVIVVDDNSPDGTGEMVYYLKRFFPKLKTLHRPYRLGYVSALLEGLQEAQGNIVGFMDTNLSHPPQLLPQLVIPIIRGQIDLTLASRYIEGAQISGWSVWRRLVNRLAVWLCLPITSVRDPLSNYFFISRSILAKTPLEPSHPKLLLDILLKSNYNAAQEIPY